MIRQVWAVVLPVVMALVFTHHLQSGAAPVDAPVTAVEPSLWQRVLPPNLHLSPSRYTLSLKPEMAVDGMATDTAATDDAKEVSLPADDPVLSEASVNSVGGTGADVIPGAAGMTHFSTRTVTVDGDSSTATIDIEVAKSTMLAGVPVPAAATPDAAASDAKAVVSVTEAAPATATDLTSATPAVSSPPPAIHGPWVTAVSATATSAMAASATAASATATSVTAVTTTATAATASTTTTSDLLKLKEGAKEGDAEPTSEASASPQPLPTYGFTPGLQTRPLILGDEENGEVGEDGKPKPTSAPGLWEGNNCRLSIRIREAGGLPTLKKTNSPYVILAVKRQEFLTRNDANGRTNPDFEGETFHWDDVDPKVHRLYAQINTDNHHMIAVNPSVKLDFLTTVPRTTSGQQPYVWKYPIPLWDDEAYLAGHLLLEMQARC